MSLTQPPPELPPQLREKYEVDGGMLGEGAFAIVRRLRCRTTGQHIALKVVQKYPLLIRNMLKQLDNEVQIQARLQHRHVLRLLGWLADSEYVYMLLEHCPGGSLRSLLAQDRVAPYGLPEARGARYFAQICQGVAFLHQEKCIHIDLKLENML